MQRMKMTLTVAMVGVLATAGAAIAQQVAGDPVLPPGTQPDPNTPRVNNGVTGDPRLSTPEIGNRYFDMRTKNAVAQIQALIAAASK
jgi:creatinine amidohydrolase/Fe(II)-dependent formamide hydrolase-like protein